MPHSKCQNISWRTAVELDIKNRMHIRQEDKCNSSNEYYSVKFKNTQPNYDINMMSTLAFSNRAVINYSRLFVGFSPKNIKSKEKQSPIDVLYNNAA